MIALTIRKYTVISLLFRLSSSLIAPGYTLFLAEKGLNLFEINMVNVVFYVTLLMFEIPTGAFADIYGRKNSVVVSCFMCSLGALMYGNSHTFIGFACSESTLGIGITFMNGAFMAWLKDSLTYHGHTDKMHSILAKTSVVSSVGPIVGTLLGAYLVGINSHLPFFIESILLFVTGALSVLWLTEEYFVKSSVSFNDAIKAMRHTIKVSIVYGIKNPIVRFIVLMSFIQMLAVQAPNMQWQPAFFKSIGDRQLVGLIMTAIIVILSIGHMLAPHYLVLMKNDERKALVSCQFFIGFLIAISLLFPFPFSLLCFLIHEIARGMYSTLKTAYLHDHIPSKERATLSSFEAVSPHTGGIIGLTMSGYIAQSHGIPTAWLVSGGILVIFCLFVTWRDTKEVEVFSSEESPTTKT